MAMCDLKDNGHDIYFVNGRRWAQHRASGEVSDIHRSGGRYELDGELLLGPVPNGAGTSVSPLETAAAGGTRQSAMLNSPKINQPQTMVTWQ
eukprot:5298386-Karenia_brevis.AAC.1